jgi:two-component system, chemotaxis family, response regulator Rcp1
MVTKILVAEDNPADVYLLREALNRESIGRSVELMVVSDGEQALEYVQRLGRCSNAVVPDLVVLDLNLPKSDGSDVLRCIRQTPAYAGIPVVVLTSSDSPRDRKAIESLGANAFITKPSDLDAFLALGRTLLGFTPPSTSTGFLNGARPVHA